MNSLVADALAVTEKAPDLKKELARVETELARLAETVAKIGADDALLAKIKTTRERQATIKADLQMEKKPVKIDAVRIKQELREALEGWVETMPDQQRGILQSLLTSKLTFTPREEGGRAYYEFTGSGSLSPILSGLTVSKPLQWRS